MNNFDEEIEREAIDYIGILVKAVLILGVIFFGGSFLIQNVIRY